MKRKRAIWILLFFQFAAYDCFAQSAQQNPIQYWLDRGRQSYQTYLSCLTAEVTRFASQSCANPEDIFEASQPSCRELEAPFLVAEKSLENVGYAAKAMDHVALIGMARPDVKAAILEAQIKHGCK